MTRQLLVWGLALALGLPQPMAALDTASDPELARGIRQVEEGEFDAAALTLDAVARRAREHGSPERARAELYLGVAYAGLGHEATAKSHFVQALEIDHGLTLSARQFPPRVLQILEEARLEVTPAPAKAPATVAAAPEKKKGGGVSRGLLIGAGVAVAAGAGIALAAGGGGSSSSSSGPPPPTTLRGQPRAVISNITPTRQALARVTRVTFSGRQSSDPEGQALRYSWDFGDGSAAQTAGDVAHTFGTCTCTVRLTVTDPTGLTDTASVVITSRKVDGSWAGRYSSSAPSFSVVLSQGTTNFSGAVSDGSELRGILSDPRSARFLIEGTPVEDCPRVRSFEGVLNDNLDRIDATGEGCAGASVALVLTR